MFKKFKGHYSKRKTHKTDRDVMSYEDMPLDDYEQEKTEMSPQAVKKIVLGACIAIAAGLIVFAFANRDKLTWENISNWWTYDVLGNAGHGYPVDIIGSEVSSGNFAVSQGHAVYASDTSFVTLTNSGTEVARLQLTHSNPVMKNNENRFLTYGIGSASYEISSFDETLYSGIKYTQVMLPQMVHTVLLPRTTVILQRCMHTAKIITEFTNILFRSII